jgi:hypothetical protein
MIPVSARKTKEVSTVNVTSLLTFMPALYGITLSSAIFGRQVGGN